MANRVVSTFRNYFLLPLIFFLAILNSQAQIPDGIDRDISSKKMKDRAIFAAKTGDVYSALFYYQAVVEKDSNDLDAIYQMAEMHRYSRNYKMAEETYSIIVKKDPVRYPFALYYKGLMQKMNGNYEEAKKNLLLFKKGAKGIGDKNFSTVLNKDISGCDSGMTYREFPDNIVIENAGNSVNRPHTEFSPVLLDSTHMVFGSLRMDSLEFFDIRDEEFEVQPVRQIYKAEKSNGKWEESGKYEVFNDHLADMGNFVYSPNSQKYFFSKCNKDDLGRVSCKIYSVAMVDGNWTVPELLPSPVNMDGFTTTQPAIMVDTAMAIAPAPKVIKGKVDPKKKTAAKKPATTQAPVKILPTEYLYFVSDRPGGKGNLDIWYTSYNNARKEWARPVNFSTVNTPQIECTPFFHIPTQTFYFSSNGHVNAGGLDIFQIKKSGKAYTKPLNLSFPINSPQDELSFMIGTEGNKGMLVSNRPGGTPFFHETCCDDIYAFEIMPNKEFICKLEITLIDQDTTGCLPDQAMKVFAYDMKSTKSSFDTVIVSNCKYEMPLEKSYNYKFLVEREGYQNDTLMLETREMCASAIIQKKLPIVKLKKEVAVVNEIPTEGKTFVLTGIQYDTDIYTLNDVSMAALDSILIPLLKEYPTDKLMISSHTDDQGSNKYNHRLSQQRAEHVVKYLVSKGIDPARLHAKGYGETQPFMLNQNPDGSDNPLGRAMNRRTEFLLLKEHEKPIH